MVFRPLRREGADLDLLRERDRLAHEEALGSGGLLRYFEGEASERRGCLLFCLLETRENAERAAGGAAHSGAARMSAQPYERYDLTKCADAGRSVVFEKLPGKPSDSAGSRADPSSIAEKKRKEPHPCLP